MLAAIACAIARRRCVDSSYGGGGAAATVYHGSRVSEAPRPKTSILLLNPDYYCSKTNAQLNGSPMASAYNENNCTAERVPLSYLPCVAHLAKYSASYL